jgi:ketosteroid isomerase-like protein
VTEGSVEMARVIVTGTLRYHFAGVAGTGRSFRMDQTVICHVRGGKICEARENANVGSLVDQVSF